MYDRCQPILGTASCVVQRDSGGGTGGAFAEVLTRFLTADALFGNTGTNGLPHTSMSKMLTHSMPSSPPRPVCQAAAPYSHPLVLAIRAASTRLLAPNLLMASER